MNYRRAQFLRHRPLRIEALEDRRVLAAAPQLLLDINPGPDSSLYIPANLSFRSAGFTNVNGQMFFRAADVVDNFELWTSDGTAAGTTQLPESNMPGYGPESLANFNGALYFSAHDSTSGWELWKSDGTPAGTALVKDINLGPAGNVGGITTLNGSMLFAADDGVSGLELWKSDGTPAGTVLLKDINPGIGLSRPMANVSPANVNGTLFFTADDGTTGVELWKTDGTESGTVLVKDIRPGSCYLYGMYPCSSRLGNLTNVNGTLFFTADDGTSGFEVWKSDGTEAGTVMVRDINPGSAWSYPKSLANVNGTLFFSASDSTSGQELWKTDGTAAGTVQVKDINPGINWSSPSSLTNVNGTLFFGAGDDVTGRELWKSDGTAAGTVLVRDVNPDTNYDNFQSGPRYLTNINGTLFFATNDGISGRELWQSDGTTTTLVHDFRPGPGSSEPGEFTVAGQTLYFTADDGLTGREVWTLHIEADADSDGIASPVDTMSLTYSNDFNDGTTTGTITDRGDQLLTIVDAANPADGVLITADPSGGLSPATIDLEGGASTLSLSAGDQVIATHGSVILEVLAGSVEVTFVAENGLTASSTLAVGISLTFEPETFTFTALETNTAPVAIVANGEPLVVAPGETVHAGVHAVTVNIQPDSFNLDSNGTLTVFVYGAADFNVSQVNISSVRFAGATAWQSTLVDANKDGRLDLQLKFRRQDTVLNQIYAQLLIDDHDADGILDSTRQTAEIDITGELVDHALFSGSDSVTLFLAGKSLRDLLTRLFG